MERIDIPLEGREDRDGLRAFYTACLDAAESDGHDKIASICLRVDPVDPLAVLDAIYEPDADHFYMENCQRGWAIAGAESIAGMELCGPQRFADARGFAQQWDPHLICIGDPTLPFSVPLFFISLPFFAEPETAEQAFPSGHVFIPTWQVGRLGGDRVAVANARISPGMDIEPLVERLWAAFMRLRGECYAAPVAAPVYGIEQETEVGQPGQFEQRVRDALSAIASGRYQKIVMARALDLLFDAPCQPLRILDRLRHKFPQCNAFSLQNRMAASFIGATPERLVSVAGNRYYTEALAGSIACSGDAMEDERRGEVLLASEKDLREHRHVVDSICRRLAGLGLNPDPAAQPALLRLANVQHLRTPIVGDLQPGQHILDLAAALHPTPALGGTPRNPAIADIRAWEPFPRGLFGGMVGWFDPAGNGEFAVAIRCARIRGNTARLYAGAGIVAGSDPAKEREETAVKMQALLQVIRGESRACVLNGD